MKAHYKETRSLKNKKSLRNKERDHIHHLLIRKIKNQETVIEKDPEDKDKDNEAMRDKETKRETKIENIGTVNKEKVVREKEVEVKTKIKKGKEKKK
jgi:hypothetical protein